MTSTNLRRRAPAAGLHLLDTLQAGIEAAGESCRITPEQRRGATAWLDRARRRFTEEDDGGNTCMAEWTARIADALMKAGELRDHVAIGLDDCVGGIEALGQRCGILATRNDALRGAVAHATHALEELRRRRGGTARAAADNALNRLRELASDDALAGGDDDYQRGAVIDALERIEFALRRGDASPAALIRIAGEARRLLETGGDAGVLTAPTDQEPPRMRSFFDSEFSGERFVGPAVSRDHDDDTEF